MAHPNTSQYHASTAIIRIFLDNIDLISASPVMIQQAGAAPGSLHQGYIKGTTLSYWKSFLTISWNQGIRKLQQLRETKLTTTTSIQQKTILFIVTTGLNL